MKTKANVLVVSGYGLNCEEETLRAFTQVGCKGDIIHLNDLIETPGILKHYNILAFPGGFSYGDDTGSGRAYGNKIKNNLKKEILAFVKRDTLVLGICNGFQILTQIGLLPGTLLHNEQARYIDRWVDVKVESDSPWLKGIKEVSLPIAHGEGRYYIDEKGKKKLENEKAIVGRYIKGEIANWSLLSANPNGSLDDIVGVTAFEGRVLGMMPHPERAISFLQLPHWTYLKETEYRGEKLPSEGSGLRMFKNAAKYFA
ncbi:phosphoribosylformylglycinamidine synthase I [Candidatus Kaiserbacteria bacterium]|nr:phosphoribosylformylglycinamidine synthase I [Candidatus Kaiserbacteria bacterium]